MGAADVVPGVSGGTIAFITGIYDHLLESIRRVNFNLFKIIKSQGLKAAFNYINGGFLIALFAGILTSIATLAKLISWLLETHPIPVWSFFFGLILVSVYHMFRQVDKVTVSRFVTLILGIIAAYTITIVSPSQVEPTPINLVLSGAVAICAMILPGISGSFILLLIGIYTPVIDAVKSFQMDVLVLFAGGCIVGLLTFSHLLSWLLRTYRDITITFLIGLMVGTLPKIWPWKETLSWTVNSHGDKVPQLQQNLMPFNYEVVTSQPDRFWLALFMMVIAVVLVLGLEKFAERSTNDA